jgi:hypothetical protein
MRFKTLMVIKALVCLVLGIALLLFPGALFSIFGVNLGAGGTFPAREYGSALFGILMLTWFARKVPESTARTAIILALFIYDALGFVVTLIARIEGVLNALGWLIAAIYLFFALGFGYLLTIKPGAAQNSKAK